MKLQDKALAEQEEELETEDEEDDVPTVQLTSSTNSTITIIKGDVQQIASLHHQSKYSPLSLTHSSNPVQTTARQTIRRRRS